MTDPSSIRAPLLVNPGKQLFLFAGLMLGIMIVLLAIPWPHAEKLLRENGVVESISMAGWFAAAAGMLIYAIRKPWRAGLSLAYFFILAGLRELDFHNRWTAVSITRTRFYTGSADGWPVKIVIMVFLGITLWMAARAAMTWAPVLWASLKKKQISARMLVLAIGLVFVAKELDSLPRLILKAGGEVSENARHILTIAEEVLEMGIPILVVISLMGLRRSDDTGPLNAPNR